MLQTLTDWLATDWTRATVALLPLMLLQMRQLGDFPWHKFRVWLALLSVSALEWMITPATGKTPFVTYIICDATAAIVIMFSPAGLAQKAVGAFFVPMILAHFGVAVSDRATGGSTYPAINQFAGWCQFAILLGWSSLDVGKAIYRRAYVFIVGRNHHQNNEAAR